jgi:hypothetical protein
MLRADSQRMEHYRTTRKATNSRYISAAVDGSLKTSGHHFTSRVFSIGGIVYQNTDHELDYMLADLLPQEIEKFNQSVEHSKT